MTKPAAVIGQSEPGIAVTSVRQDIITSVSGRRVALSSRMVVKALRVGDVAHNDTSCVSNKIGSIYQILLYGAGGCGRRRGDSGSRPRMRRDLVFRRPPMGGPCAAAGARRTMSLQNSGTNGTARLQYVRLYVRMWVRVRPAAGSPSDGSGSALRPRRRRCQPHAQAIPTV